jgi:hypothetical protein
MMRIAGVFVLLWSCGCAAPPAPAPAPVSEEVRRILEWEKSLRVGFVWPPGKSNLEDGRLVVTADPRPQFEGNVLYEGRFFVDLDGYLMFVADERARSEDLNFGILKWYRALRSGTFSVQYRYAFFRSYSGGPNYSDLLNDVQFLHTGVRTVTVKKAERELDDLLPVREWEKTLRVELPRIEGRKYPDDAFLEVSSGDMPELGKDVHFDGHCFVDVDGYLDLMGSISGHSNYSNYGVMKWYRRIRSGTVAIQYRYTFFRSFSGGKIWQDWTRDMEILHSGLRTIVVKKD